MHKIFYNMLTDELTHFLWEGKGKEFQQILFQDACTKLFSNMLTNEWKHFQEEDKRGKKKKEGTANAWWRPLIYEVLYHERERE